LLSIGAALAAAALAASAARAGDPALPPVEPPRACEYCTPGEAAPPPAVQEEVRRINERANWRRHGDRGETIELGTETRMRIHRAWSSGRFASSAVTRSKGAAPAPRAAFQSRSGARRATLADRSRRDLTDRRGDRADRSDRPRRRDRDRDRDRDRVQDEGDRGGSSFGRSSLGRSGRGSRGSQRSSFGTGGMFGADE
jgi:hypothetical protein